LIRRASSREIQIDIRRWFTAALPLELVATRAMVLVVNVDVAARRQTGGEITRDELNNRQMLLRAMNL